MAGRETGLRRALALLAVLGDEPAGLRVGELAARADVERSAASRSLRALAAAGLVMREPRSRRFRAGWELLALAERAAGPLLLARAPLTLRRLSDEVGETAYLSARRGDAVSTLLHAAPRSWLAMATWVGHSVPASCTAAGRAQLVDLDRGALEALLGAAPAAPTPSAPASLDELWRRLEAERARGYAVARDELEPGLTAVAAPVRAYAGAVIAAVNVGGPSERLAGRVEAVARAVVAAAGELSAALGAAPLEAPDPVPAGGA